MLDDVLKQDMVEEEKERKIYRNESKRQNIENFFENFFKEEFEDLKELLSIDKVDKRFREIIENLFDDDEKLVKNKKDEEGLKQPNRKIYSEIQKLYEYKDTSRLQEKIIFSLYPEMKHKLKVDYRSTIHYMEAESNLPITQRPDKKDIPEFLLNISNASEYFIKRYMYEKNKMLTFSIKPKNFIDDKTELDEYDIIKILSEIKKEIIEEKEIEKRIYKWFLFFLQLYYNVNEEQVFLNILNEVKKIDLEEIDRKRVCVIMSFFPEELLLCLSDLTKKKKITSREEKFESIFKSIYWYLYTVINDYEKSRLPEIRKNPLDFIQSKNDEDFKELFLSSIEDYNSNLNRLIFFQAFYSSDFEYKDRKLSSYIDSHRKAEFILYLYDHFEANILVNYNQAIYSFFTENEIEKYLNKKSQKKLGQLVDSYSTDAEDDYISEIIKVVKNNNNRKQLDKNIKKITDLYVNAKKKHGNFYNDKTLHADVRLIIQYIYEIYLYSYVDYDIYLKLKKEILRLIELKKTHLQELKKLFVLKNIDEIV